MSGPTAHRRSGLEAVTHRAWRFMFDLGWTKVGMDDTLRSRMAHAVREWTRWYRWASPVMWLTGRYDGGHAGVPRGRDMWWIPTEYVEGITASLVADLEVKHQCYVTTDYDVVRRTASDIDWRIFDLQDDGTNVKLGLWPNLPEHGGHIQPLPSWELLGDKRELRLFLWWYLMQHKAKAQWFGLRSWAYYRALHASVNDRIPFTCQAVPDRTSGGYRHWNCQRRKHHLGSHRFRNYIWAGPGHRVEYAPTEVSA